MELKEERYKIKIDGDWELGDLYIFPKAYEQVYFISLALLPHENKAMLSNIANAFHQYPWHGGYSAVNFYNRLRDITPRGARPKIHSMQYASPGWIEISAVLAAVAAVEFLVKRLASTVQKVNEVYHEIHEGLQKRKLLRIESEMKEIELAQKHDEYIDSSLKRMGSALGYEDVESINQKTGSKLKSLKILLSLYRRAKVLAEYQKEGKTKL